MLTQRPILALAPMQDVTDLPFWRLMAKYGGADVYFTEYFRVHKDSRLDEPILKSITENPTGKPVVAQMIGNDISALVRTARELENYPVAAIDLNFGCPAPTVYKKCAGGGLLRDLPLIDSILGALRETISGKFTVKTRLGFEDERTIDALLPIFVRHSLDLLTVHGRTVKQMYRDGVRYDLIAKAVEAMNCPVLANGNVYSAHDAERILGMTKAQGLMIGRGAIRNPWLFEQIRAHLRGDIVVFPKGRDVLNYIYELYEAVCDPEISPRIQVQKMKKYLNFIGEGVEPTGQFLHEIRRTETREDFFRICNEYLGHNERLPLEPFPKKIFSSELVLN
ncbi:MAG: tRNA-dihydrouridine synthase family protein [Verrucomicrobiia bacterium]